MTLPRKGLRKITVNNQHYVWSAKGNDGWIGIFISSVEGQGQLLTADVGYHPNPQLPNKHQIVTNYVIRQIVLYALANGWTPNEKKPQMNLRSVDDWIKFRDERIDN